MGKNRSLQTQKSSSRSKGFNMFLRYSSLEHSVSDQMKFKNRKELLKHALSLAVLSQVSTSEFGINLGGKAKQ